MTKIVVSTLLLCALSSGAQTQGKQAIALAPGLVCMSLQVTERQAMDPTFVVPINAEPQAASPAVGRASSIVLVRSPTVERNGYLATVMFNGKAGWIAAGAVQPWRNPGNSGRHCVAAQMSDGSLGFAFR